MMRRFSIRFAVALVTFFVGLQLAWLIAALFSPAVTSGGVRGVYVAPPAVRKRSCPTEKRTEKRVVIRRADGSVEVVETQRAPR